MKKKVALLIVVPDGDYCWDLKNPPCEHFDCYSAAKCDLNLHCGFIESDKKGRYPKPDRCKNLKLQVGR